MGQRRPLPPGSAAAAAATTANVGPPTSVKVCLAGMPRTGSSSVQEALVRLGYAPTPGLYSMGGVLPRELGALLVHGTMTEAEFLTVLGERGYDATGYDLPGHRLCAVAAAMGARVVLTERDPDQWAESFRTTVVEHMRYATRWPLSWVHPRTDLIDAVWGGMLREAADLEGGQTIDPAALTRHGRAVRASVPADQLLVFHPGEGWDPLCTFLGVAGPDCPGDVPFPWVNARAEMAAVGGTFRILVWAGAAFPFLLLLGLAWGLLFRCPGGRSGGGATSKAKLP